MTSALTKPALQVHCKERGIPIRSGGVKRSKVQLLQQLAQVGPRRRKPAGPSRTELRAQCKRLGITAQSHGDKLSCAQMSKRIKEAGPAPPKVQRGTAALIKACKRAGLSHSDNAGGTLPKAFLQAALTMPGKVKSVKRNLDVLEVCSRTAAIVKAAKKRNLKGRALDVHTSPQHHLLTPDGNLKVWQAAASLKIGGLAVVQPDCKLWLRYTSSSVHKRGVAPGGPGRGRKRARGDTKRTAVLNANREADAVAPVVDFLVKRKCLVVLEQSDKSLMDQYRDVNSIIRRHHLQRTLVHACRYGWPSGKRLTLHHNLPFAAPHLGLKCGHKTHKVRLMEKDANGHWVATVHMRESAWYPQAFAVALLRAAWGW